MLAACMMIEENGDSVLPNGRRFFKMDSLPMSGANALSVPEGIY
jgi:hypothetical protein